MSLPALAAIDDLAAWLHTTIADDDARAPAVLRTASTLVRSRAGETWVDAEGALVDDIPDAIAQVVVTVAARVWANPTGASSTGAGPFTAAWTAGLELTKAEADMVDAAMGITQIRGLGTITTTRTAPEDLTYYVGVEGQADLPVEYPTGSPLW